MVIHIGVSSLSNEERYRAARTLCITPVYVRPFLEKIMADRTIRMRIEAQDKVTGLRGIIVAVRISRERLH
jgi:arginase family enzyme